MIASFTSVVIWLWVAAICVVLILAFLAWVITEIGGD